jgi:hypothetical protein
MRNSYDSIQLNVNGLGVSPIDQSIVVFTPDSIRKSIFDFRLIEKNIQTAILLNKHFPIFPLSDTLHIVDSLGSFEKGVKKINGHSFLFESKNSSLSNKNTLHLNHVRFRNNIIVFNFTFPSDINLVYTVSFTLINQSVKFFNSDLIEIPDLN